MHSEVEKTLIELLDMEQVFDPQSRRRAASLIESLCRERDEASQRVWDAIEARIEATPTDGIAADGKWNVHVKWQQVGFVDGMRSARLAARSALAEQPQ